MAQYQDDDFPFIGYNFVGDISYLKEVKGSMGKTYGKWKHFVKIEPHYIFQPDTHYIAQDAVPRRVESTYCGITGLRVNHSHVGLTKDANLVDCPKCLDRMKNFM